MKCKKLALKKEDKDAKAGNNKTGYLKEDLMKEEMNKPQMEELLILSKLDHPNILKVIEIFKCDTHLFMITE